MPQKHKKSAKGVKYIPPKKSSIKRGRILTSMDQEVRQRHKGQDDPDQKEMVTHADYGDGAIAQMRGYLEEAEDGLERMVHRAEQKASEMVHNASEMVHRSKDAASEMVHRSKDAASEIVTRFRSWKACHFEKLPSWMKDNEHLHFGHRPQIPSVSECLKSIFRIHTETGNIWTHLIGFITFVVITIIFYIKPLCDTCRLDINLEEKLVFLCFFIGAIVCLAFSTLFHTLCCHSPSVSGLFSRLDYAGIAILIVGSVIPWLYFGFYCQFYAKLTYILAVSILGVLTIIVTLWDRFNLPEFRAYRALTFVGLAAFSAAPVIHFIIEEGFYQSMMKFSMQCTVIMGALYLTGALLYAARIPERFIPGKCDIWFQSHQIFHVLVIVAAFIHYQGISDMAMERIRHDTRCLNSDLDTMSNAESAIY